MSSSFKGHWINGGKDTGYTAMAYNSNKSLPKQPTIAAIKRAIVVSINDKKAAQ